MEPGTRVLGLPAPGLAGRYSVNTPTLREKLTNKVGGFGALFSLGLREIHRDNPSLASARTIPLLISPLY